MYNKRLNQFNVNVISLMLGCKFYGSSDMHCTSGGIKRCASLFVASTISIGASSFGFGSVKSNLFHKKQII
jgi:hypothetical protein